MKICWVESWIRTRRSIKQHILKIVRIWVKVNVREDCGGKYIRSIRDMATGNVDCVYYSMKEVLPGVNSFAVLHPDLMNEWNHLDNYLLCDPDQILDNCITPVWWTCPVCAHDYKCSPKQRILYQKRNMDACTFCKGLRRKERHYIWLREGHFTSLKMGKVTFLYYLLFKGNHVLETIIKYNLKDCVKLFL